MTRFLKLVRHQNGSWKALPADTDDLAPSSLLRKDAPIDPVQLLKALAPLLSESGGIIDLERAAQFASLMKKFSKKLVSRCVYCNVLKATVPSILSRFLEEGGWETINNWLNDAKQNSNMFFLLELLQLCKVLPMTIDRLRENNTPKLVKALTKYDHSEIKALSNELVTRWMVIIKGNDPPGESEKKKEKKRKISTESNKEQKDPKKTSKVKEKEPSVKDKKVVSKSKDKKEVKTTKSDVSSKTEKKTKATTSKADVPKTEKKSAKAVLPQKSSPKEGSKTTKEVSKTAEKPKAIKRPPSEKDLSKTEVYEDVKIKMEAEPVVKKPKVDRPKTVKPYQTKFRATGLEEEVPLPKKLPKKTTAIDKNAAAVAKSAAAKRLNVTSNDRITERKIKPESLMAINESQNSNGGIKLIPAKPRPAHILHESASFIDALCATPAILPRRKKKPPPKPAAPPPTPTSPTSPTLKPPKLQFYKDTLEMNAEEPAAKEEKAVENESPSSPPKEETGCAVKSTNGEEEKSTESDDIAHVEESINKQMMEESKVTEQSKEEKEEKVVAEAEVERVPGQLVSILAHGKRRHKRKTVTWVEDEDLKQVFYFELDETERVNVLRSRPFGDLKSIEAKREREAFEAAKRQAGDKMEESIPWWTVPILIDCPPPLVVPGCYSQEKEIQLIRQQSTLSEIYFTREMIPDSPHEPDIEIVTPQEPKIIPLDEENAVGSMIDYSGQDIPKPKSSLPPVLSTLMKLTNSQPSSQPSILGQLPLDQGLLNHPTTAASPTSPYDPGEPVGQSLLGAPPSNIPPMFNMQPPMMENNTENVTLPNSWGPVEGSVMPPEPFYQGFPINQNSGIDRIPPMMPNENLRMRGGGPMMGRDVYRGNMMRGPYPMNRPSGPRHNRRTVPCRHFIAGNCRYGAACSFLHPGVNGPLL